MKWAELINIPIGNSIEKDQLKEMIPQKGKMFLLDRVTSYSLEDNELTSQVEIKDSNIFYRPEIKGIPSWAVFEMMAQSIAALSSIKKIKEKDPVEPLPGVILTLSKFKAEINTFSSEKTITIKVKENFNSDGLCCYDCIAFTDENKNLSVKTQITAMEIKDMQKMFEKKDCNS